jgi:hypothetical protein
VREREKKTCFLLTDIERKKRIIVHPFYAQI